MNRQLPVQRKKGLRRSREAPRAKRSGHSWRWTIASVVGCCAVAAIVFLVMQRQWPQPDALPAERQVAQTALLETIPPQLMPHGPDRKFELPSALVELDTKQEQSRLLSEVEEAIRRYPSDASLYHIGALTYNELLQTERADELFSKSLALAGQNVDVLIAYADMLDQLGRHDEAVTMLSKAVEGGLLTEGLLTALGKAYAETGQLEAAVRTLEQCVERYPNSSSAHLPLAQALVQVQRFAEAEQHARIALAQDAENRASYVALSAALMRQNKKDEALALRSQMPKVDPQVMPDDDRYQRSFRSFAANTYTMLGNSYISHQSPAAAERVLIQSLKLDPQSIKAAVVLADLLHRLGRLDDSMIVYKRLTELDPGNFLNFHNLASLAVSTGNIALAENAIRRAAETDTSGNGDLLLARFLLGVGNIEEGAASAQRAADRLGNVDAYLALIAAHRARGDKASALSTFLKAKSLAPNDPRLTTFTP